MSTSSGQSDRVAVLEPDAVGVPVAEHAAANWKDACEYRIDDVIDTQKALLKTINLKKRMIEQLHAEVKRHRVDWNVLDAEYDYLDAMLDPDPQKFKDMIFEKTDKDPEDEVEGEIEIES